MSKRSNSRRKRMLKRRQVKMGIRGETSEESSRRRIKTLRSITRELSPAPPTHVEKDKSHYSRKQKHKPDYV